MSTTTCAGCRPWEPCSDLHADPAAGRGHHRRRASRRRTRLPGPHLLRAGVRRSRPGDSLRSGQHDLQPQARHAARPPFPEGAARRGEARALHARRCSCTIVDLRPDSSTYTQWLGVELSPENGRLLYVPKGSPRATRRSWTTPRSPTRCRTSTSQRRPAACAGTTPPFGIEWPPAKQRIISERDRAWPDYQTRFGGRGKPRLLQPPRRRPMWRPALRRRLVQQFVRARAPMVSVA